MNANTDHPTVTIPVGAPGEPRTGAVSFRDLPAGSITASIDGGFRVVALIAYDVVSVEGDLIEDFVEVARTAGETLEVGAGQMVIAQIEVITPPRGGTPIRATLQLRGDAWVGVDVPVTLGEVRTTALASRLAVGAARTIDVPVRIETLGDERTRVSYELAEPIPGVTLEPLVVSTPAGATALAALRFSIAAPRGIGAVTVRVLATAFGGMQREVIEPIVLLVGPRRAAGYSPHSSSISSGKSTIVVRS